MNYRHEVQDAADEAHNNLIGLHIDTEILKQAIVVTMKTREFRQMVLQNARAIDCPHAEGHTTGQPCTYCGGYR